LYHLYRYAWDDWTIHVHTNGHNPKSWLIALAGGLAAQAGSGGLLTLHSGIAPNYLRDCCGIERDTARMACLQFERVICVNEEIADAVADLGFPEHRIDILPAFLPLPIPSVRIPSDLEGWLQSHDPLLSTTLFFRPEYGFELLVDALTELIRRHPALGCVVMGTGEERAAAELLVKQKGLKDAVCFLGDVEHDACLALISRSNVFVRPTYRDGDSISVREAVSAGVPVVASDVGTRPASVLLFRPGRTAELTSQIERAFTGDYGQASREDQLDSVNRLFAIYEHVVS